MEIVKAVRNTAQRKLVLDIVRNRGDHPAADQIYEEARRKDPHISRGTVYRNLNILAELGEIKRLPMPVGPDHFDFRMDTHYHFNCRSCGAVVDAGLPYNEELSSISPGIAGYKTEWHRLILVGLCPACRAAENKDKKLEEL
ncbi:MAG: transcriptional repressor [Clostridia bacterium]|nr:transcriptional repressor [Clostridia bacterium]